MTLRTSRNWIIVSSLALVGIGLVMVYSSSALRAELDQGDAGLTMRKQLVWIALGLLIGVLTFDRDYRRLLRLAPWMYVATLILLAAVLIPGVGRELMGARRWLRMPGGLTFQVSDLAKITMVVTMATFVVRSGDRIRTLRHGTIPGLALIAFPAALIFPEPDLGTTVVVATLGLTVLFVGGMRVMHLAPAAVLVPLAMGFAYMQFPHVQKRIHSFLSPEDPSNPGTYQVRQGLIAMGSGGLFGKGLGEGEMKLFGVPEANSDFIFAILGEELGLLGTITLLFFFGAFVYHGWKIAMGALDQFGTLLAIGAASMVGLQAFVNIGVVTASLPNKGIPLPFISTGGTSALFMLVATALLLSVANTRLRADAGKGRADAPIES